MLQAFGTNDHETARSLSELTGEATVWAPTAGQSLSRSRGKHASRSHGASQSFAERGRRLLTPDEVRRLPRDEQLLFVKGTRPIRARKADYLSDPEFGDRRREPLFDENPMHVAGDVRDRARPPVSTLVGGGDDASGSPADPVGKNDEWAFTEHDLPDFLRG